MSLARRSVKISGPVCVGTITVLMSLSYLSGFINVNLEEFLRWPLAVASLISAIIFLSALSYLAFNSIKDTITSAFSKKERFSFHIATESDFNFIDNTSTRLFGSISSSMDDIRHISNIQRDAMWVLKKRTMSEHGHMKIKNVGYAIVYCLSPEGEQAISNGTFIGARPDAAHLSPSGERCPAIYIGAVAANGMHARSYMLGAVESNLNGLRKYKYAKRIYARAATKDGRRILESNDFKVHMPANHSEAGPVYIRVRTPHISPVPNASP